MLTDIIRFCRAIHLSLVSTRCIFVCMALTMWPRAPPVDSKQDRSRGEGMPNETQQVRIRADIVPSLKETAARRSITLTEVVSVAAEEWLEKHDPTWRDTVARRSLEDRLAEVWQAVTDAHADLETLSDAEANDYEGHYAGAESAIILENERSSASNRLEIMEASRDRLLAAVAALAGESEKDVRERFACEYDTPYRNVGKQGEHSGVDLWTLGRRLSNSSAVKSGQD